MGNDKVPNRSNWIIGGFKRGILYNKDELINSYIQYMLARTQTMFEYENLPETIPVRDLELILQTCRFVIITKDKKTDKPFAFYGGLGGVPNAYYQPTVAVVSNPALRFFDTLRIEDYDNKGDAVVIWNDTLHIGLLPMFDKYASLLAEVDLTLRVMSVNARIPALLKANNDTTKASMEKVLEDIESGKLAVIGEELDFGQDKSNLLETFNGGSNASRVKDFIELKQYLIGSWNNDIGLNANYNMKRESLSSSEVDLNEDALLPFIDNMLKSRQLGWDLYNKLFNANVKVKLSKTWKQIREEVLNKVDVKDKTTETEIVEESNEDNENV